MQILLPLQYTKIAQARRFPVAAIIMPSLRPVYRRLRGALNSRTRTSPVLPSEPESAPLVFDRFQDTFINLDDPQWVKNMEACATMAVSWSRCVQARRQGLADFIEALAIDKFGNDLWLNARQAVIEWGS
nr:hypothetical protein B0A51_09317 [Rachicladosporium sp. CCFEE 5018]